MAQVTLRINGYAYTIGCQDGEEKHLEAMGAEVSRRIDGVRLAAGQSGEARMLVMAAILMADDIFELRRKLEADPSHPRYLITEPGMGYRYQPPETFEAPAHRERGDAVQTGSRPETGRGIIPGNRVSPEVAEKLSDGRDRT